MGVKNCAKEGRWPPRSSVLATDLDGTMKMKDVPVSRSVLLELERLRNIGVGLILVTGRCELEQHQVIDGNLFDAVVLENGAVIRVNRTGERILLSTEGWERVRSRVREEFGAGCEEVIVSLPREFGPRLEAFNFGAPVKLMYNRDRVMVLPPGVDKGSGLGRVIDKLGWGRRCVACVGDGENDVDMLLAADVRLAVRNAVPALKNIADRISDYDDGDGWVSLTRQLFP